MSPSAATFFLRPGLASRLLQRAFDLADQPLALRQVVSRSFSAVPATQPPSSASAVRGIAVTPRCESPVAPESAARDASGDSFDARARVGCDPGFSISLLTCGEASHRCYSCGSWGTIAGASRHSPLNQVAPLMQVVAQKRSHCSHPAMLDAEPVATHPDHAATHGWRRWVLSTNHKDIGHDVSRYPV